MTTRTSPNLEQTPGVATLSKYGLEKTDYERIIANQRGCCAICGRPEFLNIDHDHESGLARGLLCSSCNYALGCFHDDPSRLLAAWLYLMNPPANYPTAESYRAAMIDRFDELFGRGKYVRAAE